MTDEVKLPRVSMVLYTDGGCRQGAGGWGIHGYTYLIDDPDNKKKKKPALNVPSTIGYIDKSDTEIEQREVVRPLETLQSFGGIAPETTNNVAELTATINGLTLALQHNTQDLYIRSDSEYVCKGLNQYMPGWLKNKWRKSDGNEVANKGLWVALNTAVEKVKAANVGFEIRWIKAHDGYKGNMYADYMATRGVFLAKQGNVEPVHEVLEGGGLDKYDAARPVLFAHPRWYFNLTDGVLTEPNASGLYEYCFGSPSKTDVDEEYLGKAIADKAYSVVWLRAPEPALSTLYNATKRLVQDYFGNVMIGRMDHIYNPFNHKDLVDYQGGLLARAPMRVNKIVNCTEAVLVEERNPPGISYRAVESLRQLGGILSDFYRQEVSAQTAFFEVTDALYHTVETKKASKLALVDSIKQITKAVKFTVPCAVLGRAHSVDLTCTLGLSLPPRNVLSGIAGLNPKVYVFTLKESDIAFHYGTIVVCDEGYLIMANVYADLRILSKKELTQ